MGSVEPIYPGNIRLDGGTQPRSRIDPQVCDEYAERMRAGEEFPCIVVYFDGTNYWLADGFHRIHAHIIARPTEPLACEVHQGTLEDAQWHSYSVNKSHGVRRNTEDKVRAVRAALLHSKAQNASDRQIAEHVGVSHEMVRKHRAKLSVDCQPLTVTERTGRDGRTINTAKIGQHQRKKVHKPRSASEVRLAIQEGHRVRLSSMVKLELPNNHVENCAYDLLEHFTFEYLRKVFEAIVCLHQKRSTQESST